MNEKIINEIIADLYENIPCQYLEIIKNKLLMHLNDYDIVSKETEVSNYTGYLPEFYKVYFVSRKIEGLSIKTLKLYDLILNNFFLMVNKPIEKINGNDIKIYLFNLQESRNITNRTLDGRRAAIHAFFEWSVLQGYLDKNPCRAVNKIKYERKKREPLSKIDLEKIRKSCTTERERAIVEFLYSTGARVTELCVTKKSDIDFDKGEVVLFGKGSKHRKSYLNATCILYLTEYLKTRNDQSEYLFVSERKPHGQLKKEAVERSVRIIGKRSGINRDLFPHLFRNTISSVLVSKSVPITQVQRLLGHENINTTMQYVKILDDDVKNSHEKFS